MQRVLIVGTAVLLGMSGLLAQKAQTPKIDAQKIREAVKVLSSDELEGRGTGQK